MSVTPSSEQGRGISGIAHLFLSQSDQTADSRPVRLRPGQLRSENTTDNHTPGPSCENLPSDNHNSQANDHDRKRSLAGITLLADHLDNSRQAASIFIRHWTEKNERVGVLFLETGSAELIEFVKQLPPEALAAATPWDELFGSTETDHSTPGTTNSYADSLTAALKDLSRRCDTLLINIGKGKRPDILELMELCRHTVIITTCLPADIEKTYTTIKWLSPLSWNDMDISLFVCGAENEAAARKTYEKLNNTAWEFLGIDVKWAGWEHSSIKVNERRVGIFEGGEELLEALAEFLALAGRVKDENLPPISESLGGQREASLTNQENSCLEPELEPESEKSNLTDESTSPSAPPPAQIQQDAAAPPVESPAVPPPAPRPIPLSPIPVASLPRSDRELADILQLALPGWLTRLPTVMALPVQLPAVIDPAARILIDANGRLHVFLASLSGEEILERTLQARRWLNENLAIIISSCRQIKIDRSLPIGIILSTGGDPDRLRRSCAQISDFPTQVLQLHLLQNDSGVSLLII